MPISPRASEIALPALRASSVASSSARSSIASASRWSRAERSAGSTARHPGNAALARAIAASVSSIPARGTSAITCSVAGSITAMASLLTTRRRYRVRFVASGEKSKEATPRPGGPGGTRGMLSLDDLRKAGEDGSIDTVVTAFTDMQGRLFGKRIQIEYFLEEVTGHGVEGCNYLLALDMDMEPLPGYEMANWEAGYGDFGIQPDMGTLRRIPWLDRTALVLADVVNEDGSPVVASPRQILIAVYERAREMGFTPYAASELEFYLYKESYAEAWEKDFKNLTPTIPYILDYHILATTMDESYLGPIRRGMHGAGIPIEFSKGEAWNGQHEVNTRYADAVTAADRHTIYKNGVKEIAFLNDISASFMAKPSEDDIGSSCHFHSSRFTEDGNAFVDGDEETDTFRHYLGGLRHHVRELALFISPSVNSYKRYAAESWAP